MSGTEHSGPGAPSDEWVHLTPMERYLEAPLEGHAAEVLEETGEAHPEREVPEVSTTDVLLQGAVGSPRKVESAPDVVAVAVAAPVRHRDNGELARKHRPKLDAHVRNQGGVRTWLRIDREGNSVMVQMNKLAASRRMAVPLRDLRALEPHTPSAFASAILCRQRAMVVNLEHVKCIIGLDEVFVLDFHDEGVAALVEELEVRLGKAHRMAKSGRTTKDRVPFELRCLEVALEAVVKHLEGQMADLEASAHPALDALSQRVTIVNLERVRRIKSRMKRLKGRVEDVKEVLERYLNDDDDMLDMYLSSKAVIDERVHEMLEEQARSDESQPSQTAPDVGGDVAMGVPVQLGASPQVLPLPAGDARSESTRSKSSIESEVEEGIVDEVEMLLEAYFMPVDVMYNKLTTLAEYIDDTEDFVNIKQDSQRNKLLILEFFLTSGAFGVALVTAVASIFGMNLTSKREDSSRDFLLVTIICSLGAVLFFFGSVAYMRWLKFM